jgi:hypothetical protein
MSELYELYELKLTHTPRCYEIGIDVSITSCHLAGYRKTRPVSKLKPSVAHANPSWQSRLWSRSL